MTPKMEMHIAVIIPCFNVAEHIREVVAGIPPEVGTIVTVDDCSQDDTRTAHIGGELGELSARFVEHSEQLIFHALRHLGFTFKKSGPPA